MATELAGWGANLRVECDFADAETPDQLARLVEARGTIARGLGRSYGDAAINADRRVIGMPKLDRYLSFNADSGELTCEAGVSLAQVLADFAPRGWFPYVTPGTKFVTIGGCIASDVHGKAHHDQGCFSQCVVSMRILLANGDVVEASRDHNPDLFWGTCGGMGLLGVIISATIKLRRVETTYFEQQSIPAPHLDAMMDRLDNQGEAFPYSMATINVFARGNRMGRGVLNVGNHAPLDALPAALRADPFRVSGPPKLLVPFQLPDLTLNPYSIRLVNAVILTMQTRQPPIAHYERFVYPLDFVAEWNRGYGRRGFTQYQFVIPFEDGRARVREILQTIQASGELPFLNVLKRLGEESGGVLSFPKAGYTFAIDFPIRRGTPELLRRLDAMVLDAGGRVYLGKDSFLDAGTFRAMYPQVDTFLALKAKYDPDGVFTSNLARRVGLDPVRRSAPARAAG